MSYRLLKFDIIHPTEYLAAKKEQWTDLKELSHEQYRQRLLALRSNYSDFYTYHLSQLGWEAEEFFMMDDEFYEKVARELWGNGFARQKWTMAAKDKLRPQYKRWYKHIIRHYLRHYKPDVIFVRSHPIDSEFWLNFKQHSLLVARLSARLPFHWHPNHFDIIYTDQPTFQQFFEMHGVTSILNKQGYDPRITEELAVREKKYPVSFVGGLGTQNFKQRTAFFEEVAQKQKDFRWWGYWWQYGGDGRQLRDFKNLNESFGGLTSGLEMYQIFKDSAINLNDYVDTADGIGYNQRMFEVMGTGSFLLTRAARNFEKTFPKDIFITYHSVEDCLDKVRYFLKNPAEREEIAENAAKFIAENFNYAEIAERFKEDLEKTLSTRNLKPWR